MIYAVGWGHIKDSKFYTTIYRVNLLKYSQKLVSKIAVTFLETLSGRADSSLF